MSDADPTLLVEFTQRFTVQPPDGIDDSAMAENWFWNVYPEIGLDVVDPKRKANYEVLDVCEGQRQAENDEGSRLGEGDSVTVYGRPATVVRTIKPDLIKVRFEDNGTVAWPGDEAMEYEEMGGML